MMKRLGGKGPPKGATSSDAVTVRNVKAQDPFGQLPDEMKVQIVANEVMERITPGIQAAIQERVESQTGALLADKAGKAVEAAMEKRLVSTEDSVTSLSAKVDSLKTSMIDKFKSLKTSMADKSRQQELMMHNIDDDASTRIGVVLERMGDVEGRAASLSLALVSKVLFSDVGINLFVSLTIVYSLSLSLSCTIKHNTTQIAEEANTTANAANAMAIAAAATANAATETAEHATLNLEGRAKRIEAELDQKQLAVSAQLAKGNEEQKRIKKRFIGLDKLIGTIRKDLRSLSARLTKAEEDLLVFKGSVA